MSAAGADDGGEEDPFLRAMSRASTPPTSVMSDLDSTAAARYSSGPPSLEGNSSDEEVSSGHAVGREPSLLHCFAPPVVLTTSHELVLSTWLVVPQEVLSPAGGRHRASGGGASPVAVPAGASRLSRQSAAQPSWKRADSPGDQAATGAEAELRRADGPGMLSAA